MYYNIIIVIIFTVWRYYFLAKNNSRNTLIQLGWKQKIFRLRPDYINICTYLDFHASKTGKDIYYYYDQLFLFSFDHLSQYGFNYNIENFKPLRTNKGFFLSPSTLNRFFSCYNFYSYHFSDNFERNLLVAEFVELLLYIYINYNLTSDENMCLQQFEYGISTKL